MAANRLTIEPQDKTPLQRRDFQLHPRQIERLEEFAKSLNSDVNYVLGKIIEQVEIGNSQGRRGRPTQSAPQPKKEAEKKSAAAVA